MAGVIENVNACSGAERCGALRAAPAERDPRLGRERIARDHRRRPRPQVMTRQGSASSSVPTDSAARRSRCRV
jgi:hypothetical protein